MQDLRRAWPDLAIPGDALHAHQVHNPLKGVLTPNRNLHLRMYNHAFCTVMQYAMLALHQCVTC